MPFEPCSSRSPGAQGEPEQVQRFQVPSRARNPMPAKVGLHRVFGERDGDAGGGRGFRLVATPEQAHGRRPPARRQKPSARRKSACRRRCRQEWIPAYPGKRPVLESGDLVFQPGVGKEGRRRGRIVSVGRAFARAADSGEIGAFAERTPYGGCRGRPSVSPSAVSARTSRNEPRSTRRSGWPCPAASAKFEAGNQPLGNFRRREIARREDDDVPAPKRTSLASQSSNLYWESGFRSRSSS